MKLLRLLIPAAALGLAACQTPAPVTPPPPVATPTPCPPAPACPPTTPPPAAKTEAAVRFEPASYAALPTTRDQDWAAALSALRASCQVLAKRPAWTLACAEAGIAPAEVARQFFENRFTPYRVISATLVDGQETRRETQGLMTGYYEPLLRGSRTRTAPYLTPLYRVPDDLLVIDLASLYPELGKLRLRGRLEGRKVVPYDSRAQIGEGKRLAGQELVWVDDPLAAFFLQVQGSGRVQLPDGSQIRLGYADQNGHPYKAIGRWLIDQGHLKASEVSMQSITDWARRNPKRRDELLDQNPSYVFFRESAVGNPAEGPRGALGVALTPQASIAVDRRFIPLGAPLVIAARQPEVGIDFARPVLAQDTGGAIRGPLRFDYFWGFGPSAGERAGRQKSEVQAWLLVPKGAAPEQL